jgi:hypothetical protein
MEERYNIIKRRKGWAVKKEGKRAAGIYPTKEHAITCAEKFRDQGYDVVVHKENGYVEKWLKGKYRMAETAT